MRWLLVALLQLTAAVLSSGQTRHPQTCPDSKILSTPLNDEKVKFFDNECMMTCEYDNMNHSSVTLCINPCGVTNITFEAEYYVPGRKYAKMYFQNDGKRSFSVKLEFSYNETSVSLALHSGKIARTTATEEDVSASKTLKGWIVKHGNNYLPFRFINNFEQCDPPITTTQTIVNTERTSTTALLTASTEATQSADDKESKPEVILAENKYAFAAGGVLGIILIIVIIIAVCRVRKKRSNAEPGVPNVKGGTPVKGGLTRHCSVNSLYDASSPKPLERHESVNSLYGTHDTEYLSTATLNQLLRPLPHGQVNSDLKNTLPGSTVHYESENSLYYNPTEDTDKSAQGIRNIYDPV